MMTVIEAEQLSQSVKKLMEISEFQKVVSEALENQVNEMIRQSYQSLLIKGSNGLDLESVRMGVELCCSNYFGSIDDFKYFK